MTCAPFPHKSSSHQEQKPDFDRLCDLSASRDSRRLALDSPAGAGLKDDLRIGRHNQLGIGLKNDLRIRTQLFSRQDSSRETTPEESPARQCREPGRPEVDSRQGRHPGRHTIFNLCTRHGVLRVLCASFASSAVTVFAFVCVFLGLCSVVAVAQHHADLAPAEVDQLRDAALDPDQRLKLYLKFARARLAALDQIRADPKIAPAERPAQIHDHLQDFLNLYDELDDNIDMYVDRKEDIRKPLKAIIEADSEFQTKIKAFQEALQASKENVKSYEFLLSNLQDTLASAADDHRKLMAEQEEAAKHARKHRQQKQ